MKDAIPPRFAVLRSLGIVSAAVTFAGCAALVALALMSMNWRAAAIAAFAAAGIGFAALRIHNNETGSHFWPMMSVWLLTTTMMVAVLLLSA